ncbi:MAG: fibronectin type III domain-containing protein [Epsilonproteobacteria bacterium]|nr:fibronectin type III domain-containing protein [Campylobacterota bacterium]
MKKLTQIISFLVLMIFLSACVKPSSIIRPEAVSIDDSLPPVTGLKAISDMTQVALEWKPNYADYVEGYSIYRAVGDPSAEFLRIAHIKNRYASHYVDKGLEPSTTYFYRVSLFTKNDIESPPSETLKVVTKPRLESVPFVKAIGGLANQIKILWRPHPNPKVVSYIIERREAGEDKWKKIDEVEGRLNAEYIDRDVDENKIYYYRVKVKTYDGVISKPSKEVKANTKPLPRTVTGLKATTNLPREIKLTWDPNPEKDIAYYKIYRNLLIKDIFRPIGKSTTTEYVDKIKKDGAVYYYKVTAVDKDGLESLMQDRPVMGKTLDKPKPPKITYATVVGTTANIEWTPMDDRAVSYIVIKSFRDGLKFRRIKFTDIKSNSFVDRSLKPGIDYKFRVMAVDRYGIESEPSEKVVLRVKE